MPNHDEIVGAIKGIMEGQLDLPHPVETLGPDTPLFYGGLELDSFSVVELISALETQFSVEFQEDDFLEVHFRNVGTLGALVSRYLDQASPP